MTDSSLVASYLAELEAALKRGDAREHTHRPAIHHLLEASGERITATNEPAREGGNAPGGLMRQIDEAIGEWPLQ